MKNIEFESEYIKYLISNLSDIDEALIESYLLNKIPFDELIENIDFTKVQSYKNFIKSKKIDNLLK